MRCRPQHVTSCMLLPWCLQQARPHNLLYIMLIGNPYQVDWNTEDVARSWVRTCRRSSSGRHRRALPQAKPCRLNALHQPMQSLTVAGERTVTSSSRRRRWKWTGGTRPCAWRCPGLSDCTPPSYLCTQTATMKNDEGEVVDLYIPRKWCVPCCLAAATMPVYTYC